jgi:hypothetical protein
MNRILKVTFIDTIPPPEEEPCPNCPPLYKLPEGEGGALISYYLMPSGLYLHFSNDNFLVSDRMCAAENYQQEMFSFVQDVYCFCSLVRISAISPDQFLAVLEKVPENQHKVNLEREALAMKSYSNDVSDIITACQKFAAEIKGSGGLENKLADEESQYQKQ